MEAYCKLSAKGLRNLWSSRLHQTHYFKLRGSLLRDLMLSITLVKISYGVAAGLGELKQGFMPKVSDNIG